MTEPSALIVIGILLTVFSFAAYAVGGGRSGSLARFALYYLAVFAPLLLLEAALVGLFPSLYEPMRHSGAVVVSAILNVAGVETSVEGAVISFGETSVLFNVTAASLGGIFFWAYLGVLVAERRANFHHRLTGLIFGLPILFWFSLLRLVAGAYAEGVGGVAIHDYVYVLNVVLVLLVWSAWLNVLRPEPSIFGHRATPSPPGPDRLSRFGRLRPLRAGKLARAPSRPTRAFGPHMVTMVGSTKQPAAAAGAAKDHGPVMAKILKRKETARKVLLSLNTVLEHGEAVASNQRPEAKAAGTREATRRAVQDLIRILDKCEARASNSQPEGAAGPGEATPATPEDLDRLLQRLEIWAAHRGLDTGTTNRPEAR